jgi:type IV pilus assembly protein PilM
MARPAVGLDIGSSCVKAIQLRRAGKGEVEIEKFGIAELNVSGPPPTGAQAREAKTEAIRAAMRQAGITAKQVVTSVSGEPIIVRYIQLPDMPEHELHEALKWEAEEYIPFSLEDVNLGSAILGKTSDGSKVNVLLVAAKKDLVNERLEIITKANLKPVMVDVDSFAFLNCFELNYQPDASSVTALINIGSAITNINVYYNGVSHFSRDIAIAGNSITAAIQNKLGKDWFEAEQLKIMEGAPEPAEALGATEGNGEQTSLLNTIRGTVEKLTGEEVNDNSPEALATRVTRTTLNSLLAEIRRSIQFCENQADGRPVEQAILGGGGARMKNIAACFSSELNLPVEIFDPLKRIKPRGSSIDTNTLNASKLFLGVGIGLALRKVID